MMMLNVSLPDSIREIVDEKVSAGDYPSASDYICKLIVEDQKREVADRLEGMLLEGLDSGEPIEATAEWWEQKRDRLLSGLEQDA